MPSTSNTIWRREWRSSRWLPGVLVFVLLALGAVRIVATYHVLSQAADEPATIAAGMEWLDKGTYNLDPLHPPLARVAAAVGPFLEGRRLPQGQVIERGPEFSIFKVGNEIFYEGGRYWRTLALARLSMLPFFAFGVAIVFFWGRRIDGNVAGLLGVFFFTSLPAILAFAGFAYTDMPVGVLIAGSAFMFVRWLDLPSMQNSILFGVLTALALLSKFTALLFLPACWVAIVFCWIGTNQRREWRLYFRQAVWIVLTFFVIFWGGYRFSVAPLKTVFLNPGQDIHALHVPQAVKRLLYFAVDKPIPAPAFFKGVTASIRSGAVLGRPSYLLGEIRQTGWWYFFIVAIGVKTPLAFLLLGVLGLFLSLMRGLKERNWQLAAPGACIVAILVATFPVRVNYGVRHILCIYPFLSVMAAYGGTKIYEQRERWGLQGRVALAGLLAWHLLVTSHVHPDYVTYFNELAGRQPQKILMWGCDYDCGQDVARLARLLGERKIQHVTLGVFGNNDFKRSGLPPFENLDPYQRPKGWVAASVRIVETGDAFLGGSHRDAFQWLSACKPLARAGETIYLYEVPCGSSDSVVSNP